MDDEQRDENAEQEEDEHRVFHELDVLAVVARVGVVPVAVGSEVVEAFEEVSAWTEA